MKNKGIGPSARTALVIDDEPHYRECVSAELRAHGFEVVATGVPSVALQYCEELDFDLVIASLNTPSLGGIAFLQLIRLRHKRLPIIVISPFYSMQNTATAFRNGASEFLRKPENPRKLLEALDRIVEGEKARSQAA